MSICAVCWDEGPGRLTWPAVGCELRWAVRKSDGTWPLHVVGLLKELGAEKKHLASRCSRRSKQRLQDSRSPRTSLALFAVSQAATGAGLDPRAGQVDPVSHERSSTCVQEGRNGRVALETANLMYFVCIV